MTRPTRFFFRDDDVGGLTDEFTAFFGAFSARGLPVSYQIIPERLTTECAAFIQAEQEAHPDLVEFGQHGLRHEMMARGKLVYYEFGPERAYAQQLADIQSGLTLLRERLGPDVDLSVFTPPKHRYNRDTLKAIRASGFEVLSASSYTTPLHRSAYAFGRALGLTNLGRPGIPHHGAVRPDSGLFEISVAVGVDDGGAIIRSVEETLGQIEQAREHTTDLGVLFHHQAFKGSEGADYIRRLLDGVLQLPNVSFHTIGQIRNLIVRKAA